MQAPPATAFHLAQLNIGRFKGPIDSPVMAEFAAALDEINALAEASPGFVWRLKDESNNATGIRPFNDPLLAVNLSVWESIDSLKQYVFHTMHGKYLARRRSWFEKMDSHHLVMWWIPAGTRPTLEEAKRRLELLESKGESPEAFTFRTASSPSPATAG